VGRFASPVPSHMVYFISGLRAVLCVLLVLDSSATSLPQPLGRLRSEDGGRSTLGLARAGARLLPDAPPVGEEPHVGRAQALPSMRGSSLVAVTGTSRASRALSGMSAWWGEMAASLAAVFMISFDDVMWLLPFAVHRRKQRFMCFYLFCMQLVVLAACLAVDFEILLAKVLPANVPINQLFQWFSTSLLVFYTAYLFIEWRSEQDSAGASARAVLEQQKGPINEPARKEQKRTLIQLFVISSCGSINNFTVYAMLLMSHLVSGPQLVVAVVLVSALVVALCLCAGQVRPVVTFIEGIPLWCIMTAVCTWSMGTLLTRHGMS